MEGRRIEWLDYARIFALISIMSNHAVSRTFDNYIYQQAEFQNFSLISEVFKSIATTFSWLGVPVFLMITGALLLNRKYDDISIKKFYKHNWLSLLIATEIWSLLGFFFIEFYYNGTSFFDFTWILRLLGTLLFINKTEFGCMWYMDMIVCLYISIPIFACILQSDRKKLIRPLLLLLLFTGFLMPTICKYINVFFNTGISFNLIDEYTISSYTLFVLLGYYISKQYLKDVKSGIIWITMILSFIITVIFQLIGYASEVNLVTRYSSMGILICSVCIFELFRRYNLVLKKMDKKGMVPSLSKSCFAIYMIHIFFVQMIFKKLNMQIVIVNHFLTFFVYLIVPFAISILLVRLLKKNKWIKKNMFLMN